MCVKKSVYHVWTGEKRKLSLRECIAFGRTKTHTYHKARKKTNTSRERGSRDIRLENERLINCDVIEGCETEMHILQHTTSLKKSEKLVDNSSLQECNVP
jgi:hypothetical protein